MIKTLATALLCVLIPLGVSANQGEVLEEFRGHLDAGDYEALETRAQELLSSAEGIAAYRAISSSLYRTTHPQRLETLDAWLAAFPRSSHALTANAWAEIHAAYAAGLSDSGVTMGNHPNIEGIKAARARALELAGDAYGVDNKNVSAIDAWMHTLKWEERGAFFGIHARRLLALAPTRESILSIMHASSGFSVTHKERELIGICLNYAELAEGYGVDECMIDVAYRHSIARDLKLEVAAYLRSLPPDERFDYARLDEALYPTKPANPDGSISVWPDDLTADDAGQLEDWFLSALAQKGDPHDFARYAARLGSILEDPEFKGRMQGHVLLAIDAWLLDDPYNPRLLEALMRLNFESGATDEIAPAFHDLLELGWHSSDAWVYASVGELRRDEVDFRYATELLETATAAQGNNIYALSQSHFLLREALEKTDNGDAGREEAECVALRLARLSDGVCQIAENVEHICENEDHPAMMGIAKTLRDADANTCPDVQNARLSDLRYAPVDLLAKAKEIRREGRWRALMRQDQ
ncbi:MAG: hypothetical protein AAGA87_00340 [Pseudomonadota bacterium]